MEIPAGIATVEESAFQECKNLSAVTFAPGSRLLALDDCTFKHCSSLKEISLPDGMARIGSECFFASGLVDAYVPPSVTDIGANAFPSAVLTVTQEHAQ